MTFDGILFQHPSQRAPDEALPPPDCFTDLNLDQIVVAVTAGKDEYDLKSFFSMPLHDVDAVTWRHEIMRDLEESTVFDVIKTFERQMRSVREHHSQIEKLHYELQKQAWFLDAVNIYGRAVMQLTKDLESAPLASRGLRAFRDYLRGYTTDPRFASLAGNTATLLADLASVHYTTLINGTTVHVRKYGGEPDYTSEVESAFEKFKQGAGRQHVFKFSDVVEMNHVEARILELVAQLHPDVFGRLDAYYAANRQYRDPVIITFDREIQFYVAYLEHIGRLKGAGLRFCYPRIARDKVISSEHGFDLALAAKLLSDHKAVVTNDVHLSGRERMIVVSGPNQGGKTTFARMFGQLHYLASLGCPVPGSRAQLALFDHLLTHFEREETMKSLRGKLQDDLVRLRVLLDRATSNSIVILNEIFTSTTLRDAVSLSQKIARRLVGLDLLCVWVTFIDELASLGPQTVSMTSTVVPEDPAERTFKIVRRPADGLAYALSIAEKHRVTQAAIQERLRA